VSNDKFAATFRGENLAKPDWVGLAKGSDDEYCSVFPTDGHHWVSHSVQAPPLKWVDRCSFCGRISSAKLRAQLAEASPVEATALNGVLPSSGGGTDVRQPENGPETHRFAADTITLQEFDD
jgi:hypothetical protein